MKYVRAKDKATVMNELKCVYNASSASEAEAILYDFMVKYSKIYPKAVTVLEDLTSLFVFYEFQWQSVEVYIQQILLRT